MAQFDASTLGPLIDGLLEGHSSVEHPSSVALGRSLNPSHGLRACGPKFEGARWSVGHLESLRYNPSPLIIFVILLESYSRKCRGC